MDRRQYLALFGSGLLTSIAGCSQGNGGTDVTSDTTSGTSPTQTTTKEKTEGTTEETTTESAPAPTLLELEVPDETGESGDLNVSVTGEVDVHDGYYYAETTVVIKGPEGDEVGSKEETASDVSDSDRQTVESTFEFDTNTWTPGNYTVEATISDIEVERVSSPTASSTVGIDLEELQKIEEVDEILEEVYDIFENAVDEFASYGGPQSGNVMNVTVLTADFEEISVLRAVGEAEKLIQEAKGMDVPERSDEIETARMEYELLRELARMQASAIELFEFEDAAWEVASDVDPTGVYRTDIVDTEMISWEREHYQEELEEVDERLDTVEELHSSAPLPFDAMDYEEKIKQIESDRNEVQEADGWLDTYLGHLDKLGDGNKYINDGKYTTAITIFDEVIDSFDSLGSNIRDAWADVTHFEEVRERYVHECSEREDEARERRRYAAEQEDK